MSVLTKTEKNSRVGRIFLGGVIVMLLLGSVSMIYPFVLMISGSLRSEMDGTDMSIVPRFLVDQDELARKFLETKYDYSVSSMNLFRGYQDFSFPQATLPTRIVPRRIGDFKRFVEEADLPDHWWGLGGTLVYRNVASANSTLFVERLRELYDDDILALGEDLGAPISKWRMISAGIPQWEDPRWSYEPSLFYNTYFSLLYDRPLAERTLASPSGWFLRNMIFPKYGKTDTVAYNEAHAHPIEQFKQFSLPRVVPDMDQPQLREEWITFVRGVIHVSFLRTTAPAQAYRHFVAEKYLKIDALNARWQTDFTSFEEIFLPGNVEWVESSQRPDYVAFLNEQPVETLYLVGPEFAWQDWLKQNYNSLEKASRFHEREVTQWQDFPLPMDEVELQYVRDHAGEIRMESATRNYRTVLAEIVFQGRPLRNTLIYVMLALFFSLTLQPLAAYSLSRFNPPGTWRIILIFMATMAFPPMVGMIPQFLILRQFNLLNTFFGLVLPTLVNGYLIFLLKGFFDSLPQHLYEAALIDGAGEIRMFFTLTMALSKPILAVVALGTFNHAWLAFLYPLLVCPKEEMHVLAIWLYQFQQQAATPTVFASIMITSIPSLLIFMVTQRTIMRGIAVPAEK